ncbi:MAG TPA: tetratricopeptide repeat protein [Polyangiaceae bacterium]|jgi:tetratricopeptide (TPR) repeat protein|nr:tetratricopeptide repeat protein [Polyangiaceae bacterium]
MACCRADLLALAFAFFVALPPASAQPARMTPEARAHFERGRNEFEAHHYDAAIEEFRAGYRLQPHADFLYSLAQAERLRGDCRAAIDTYRAFLATAPPESEAELAKGHITSCERALAPPAPKPRPKRPPPKPTPAPAPEERWYEDQLGHVLCALGVAVLGVGTALAVLGESRARATHDPATLDDFEDAQSDAKALRIAAPITLAVGGALFVGGVVRFATVTTTNGGTAFVSVTTSF